MPEQFDYFEAFARNIGWVTEAEQSALRGKRVAIAGMGGVGGVHLLTLARLGVGRFAIADMDRFDLANMNRQVGASMQTLGRPKVEVLAEMAKAINPEVEIEVFDRGVDEGNLAAFLRAADAYVDGLDFFAFDARERTFAKCAELGIPAVTAAPIGMGVAALVFLPGGMTFDDYFGFSTAPNPGEKALRFLLGLTPRLLHGGYLVDPSRLNLQERRGPSTAMACQLCAGVAGTETLKILLGRGPVRAAPRGLHFDAYKGRLVKTWRPGGYRNPLQQVLMTLMRRQYGARATGPGTTGQEGT